MTQVLSRHRLILIALLAGTALFTALAVGAWRQARDIGDRLGPDSATAVTALALAHAEMMAAAATEPSSLLARWEAFAGALTRITSPPLRSTLFALPPYAPAVEASRAVLAGTELAADGTDTAAFAAVVRRLGRGAGPPLTDLRLAAETAADENDLAHAAQVARLEWLQMAALAVGLLNIGGFAAVVVLQRRAAQERLAVQRTARQAAERAATETTEAARRKADLLATASDDLRSPLNRVVGLLTEAIEPAGGDQRLLGTLAEARRTAHGLLALIGDLADLARLEGGRITLEEAPFRPADVAARVVQLLAPRAEERRAPIELQVAGDLPDWWHGDGARLRQVLFALVGAAVRSADSARVTVRLGTAPQGGLRVVAIAAGGAVRDEAATEAGLALAREIVGLMGGTLTVRSGGSAGFTGMLDLPLRPGEPPDQPGRREGAPLQVLVADPSETHRRLLGAILDRHGHATLAVAEAQAALEKARGGGFDAVFLASDLSEPSASAIARVLRAGAETAAATIVLVGSNLSPAARAAALAAGFDSVLPTPLAEDAVLSALAGVRAASAERPSAPLVDSEMLGLVATSLAPETGRALVKSTLAEAREHLVQLEAAAARGDRAAAASAARMLAVAADVIGAARLRMQADAVSDRPATAGTAVAGLRRTLAETEAVLRPSGYRPLAAAEAGDGSSRV